MALHGNAVVKRKARDMSEKRSQQDEDIGRRWLDCTIQPQWVHNVLDVCINVLILLLIDTHMHLWRLSSFDVAKQEKERFNLPHFVE